MSSPPNENAWISAPQQALGRRGNVSVTDLRPQLRLSHDRGECRHEMAFPDAAIARECRRLPLPVLKRGNFIEPFRHQFRRQIRKMVSGESGGRISRKIQ